MRDFLSGNKKEVPAMATNGEYGFPIWGTQGGGLVREVNGVYVFVIAPPNCPGLGVGDTMPDEWGITPANEAAHDEVRWTDEDRRVFEEDSDLFFGKLFEMESQGEISLADIRGFFPNS